jgi:hypothetical protein
MKTSRNRVLSKPSWKKIQKRSLVRPLVARKPLSKACPTDLSLSAVAGIVIDSLKAEKMSTQMAGMAPTPR